MRPQKKPTKIPKLLYCNYYYQLSDKNNPDNANQVTILMTVTTSIAEMIYITKIALNLW